MKKPLLVLLIMMIGAPCLAQWFVPDPKDQLFVLAGQLSKTRDSLRVSKDSINTLNIRVDTLLAADKRVRQALKQEAKTAVDEANVQLGKATTRADNAEKKVVEVSAERDEARKENAALQPRTWVGRQLRHAWNGLAYVGIATVGYVGLRVLVF